MMSAPHNVRFNALAGCAAALLSALAACAPAPTQTAAATAPAGRPTERTPVPLPLAAPFDAAQVELSGLAWHGDTLILLPQYPDRVGGLLALPRQALLDVIEGRTTAALVPRKIPLDDGGLARTLPGFEGFEAIAIIGDQLYLTIERRRGPNDMVGALVAGALAADDSAARLDAPTRQDVPAQAPLDNLSDEAIAVFGDRLLTFYEANGAAVNAKPVAHLFDTAGGLRAAGTLPAATLEYRLTDATPADADGRFWVINYQFPGDAAKLKPAPDALAARFGQGESHARCPQVERLVELRATAQGVALTETPPVQLTLLNCQTARNWEGLVVLPGRGFLLATDSFPGTILAFVPR